MTTPDAKPCPPAADGERRRRSRAVRWSIRLGVVALVIGGLVAGFFYDPPLKSWADLEPPALPEVPAEKNGYLWLREQWEPLPDLDSDTWAALDAIQSGKTGWDDGHAGLKKSGDTRRAASGGAGEGDELPRVAGAAGGSVRPQI